MTAVVGNINWSAVEIAAKRENGRITLEGTSAIDSRIVLTLHGDTAGTYPLGIILHEGSFLDGLSQWHAYGVNAGSVTVTLVDSLRVAGYFGFQAKDTTGIEQPREISGGTFDVDFTQ